MAADNRKAIRAALVARMQTIIKANGYNTDVGLSVTSWRTSEPAESACPTIDVRDSLRTPAGMFTQNIRDYTLGVAIAGFVASGSDTEDDMDDVIEDVMKAMLDGDVSFGGLAINTVWERDDKGISQNNAKVGVAVVRFLIQYRKQ